MEDLHKDNIELQQLREALAASERRYRTLAETADDVIYIIDRNDRVEYVNSAAAASLGKSRRELIGRKRSELFPPQEAQRQKRSLDSVFSTGEPYSAVNLAKLGEQEVWLDTRLTPIKDDNGDVRAVLGISRDITALKKIEDDLRRRVEMENLVAGISTTFIDLAAEDIEAEIAHTMHTVGEFAGVDRVFFFMLADGGSVGSVFEWCAPGIQPRGKRLKEVIPAEHPGLTQALNKSNHLLVRDVSGLPEHIRRDVELLHAEGVRSLCVVPILRGGTPIGGLGIDVVRSERCLDQFDAVLLRMIAEICAGSLERKKRSESLRMLSAVVEQSSEGIAMADLEGKLQFVNRSFAQMHGYTPEELAGKHLSVFHAPEQMPEIEEFNKTLLERGFLSAEVWHQHRDGRMFPTSMSNWVLRDVWGQPTSLVAMARDISELKQATDALRESEENYRRLFEYHPAACFAYDREGRILMWNREAARLYGCEADEVIGQRFSAMFGSSPEAQSRTGDIIKQVFQGRAVSGLEWCDRDLEGRVRWVLTNTYPIRDERGEPILGISSNIDITARKEAQAQMQRLAQAVENAGEGIGIWSRDWTLLYCNAALAKIFGWDDPAQIVNVPWSDMVDTTARGAGRTLARDVESTGRWEGKTLGRRRDGKIIPISVTVTRFGPSNGDILFVVNIHDMSAEEAHLAQVRKLTEDAHKRLESERARIGHELHDELGQLATAIDMGLSHLCRKFGDKDSAIRDNVVEMQEIVTRMKKAIRHLAKSLRPPILDHQGLCEAIQSHVDEFSRRTGVRCEVYLDSPDLGGNDNLATSVFRIIQEALTNVARHSQASRCEVMLKETGSVLVVKVKDNGRGASPEELSSRESLGLVGMRERAVSVGGGLRIVSRPGSGLCVTARLPMGRPSGRNSE